MKITEVIEVPAYSSSVRIVDGQAILVAENGNGKTDKADEKGSNK